MLGAYAFEESGAVAYEAPCVRASEARLGCFDEIGETTDEIAKSDSPVTACLEESVGVIGIDGTEGRTHGGHGVVHLMGHEPYELDVGGPLGGRYHRGYIFYEIKCAADAIVDEMAANNPEKMAAVGPESVFGSVGYLIEPFLKRGEDVENRPRRGIDHALYSAETSDHHANRCFGDEQGKKMALFLERETLGVHTGHHLVENLDERIDLGLPQWAQSHIPVLSFKQIHAVCQCLDGNDHLAVEKDTCGDIDGKHYLGAIEKPGPGAECEPHEHTVDRKLQEKKEEKEKTQIHDRPYFSIRR